ncbi:MAG: hypothetical protein U9N32_10295 [Spirochaetota bacterium]|nr:hypothetical protein [Spirochaetota bacterium]
MNSRPMYMNEKPNKPIKAARGTVKRAKTWEAEAALPSAIKKNIRGKTIAVPSILKGSVVKQF